MKPFALILALSAATPGLAQNLLQEPTEPIPVVVIEETAGGFTSGTAMTLAALLLLILAAGR